MSITGKVKTLFTDKTKTEALFPHTKVKAISDDNNVGLNVLLDNKQEKHKPFSIFLLASNWSNMTQTVNIESVTENNSIFPAPAPENFMAYCEAGIYCSAQSDGTLTFTCTDTPSVDLVINVMVLD